MVYLSDAPELLPSLVGYGLYLPLEGYDEITSAYDSSYIDGVSDVMTYDGHIFGVPYSITGYAMVVKEKCIELGLQDIDRCTIDDFWRQCAEAEQYCGINLSVANDKEVFASAVVSYIEDGMEKKNMDKTELKDLIANFKKYMDSQTLGSSNEDVLTVGARAYLNSPQYIPAGVLSHGLFGDDYVKVVANPSVNGKNYVSVNSMYYVNSKTKNPDMSVKYLAMLMSEENVYRMSDDKSFLAPDADKYYYVDSNILPDKLALNGYRPKKVQLTKASTILKLNNTKIYSITHTSEALSNACPRIYSYSLDKNIEDIFKSLKVNKITVDEAADRLYTDISCQLME